MLKIFLWFVSKDKRFFQDAIKILEQQNGIELVGAAAGEEILNADEKFFDVILVVGAKNFGMSKIARAARQLHLLEEKLLGDWIVCIPGFALEKYRKLQRSRLSIFSMNCFGGMLSHTLGLPFLSPFVNLWLSEKNFIDLLRAPRAYMEKNFLFKEMARQPDLNFDYPVVALYDIVIYMNHYRSFDAAVEKWNERKQRINWKNIFVTMYTSDEKILQEFDALPYDKKVCFVPFKSDLNSAWFINPAIKHGLEFWNIVNQFGKGNLFCYDPFDMLLYGKKTQLVEM